MTINAETLNILLGALITLQAWQLTELIRLKIRVAELTVQIVGQEKRSIRRHQQNERTDNE